jgi:transposase
MVRTALYEATSVMLTRTVRFSSLKAWGMAVARRRCTKKARVALARKLGVILRRMWVDGADFRWSTEETAIA